jgi:predicted O-methyltransferase YrrM
MNSVLEEIFNTSVVIDEDGTKIPLHSHTSRAQCQFLNDIIQSVKPSRSLEVGLAFGVSTLQILDSMSAVNKDFEHVVMDPMQDDWKNIGKLNIERAGYSKFVTFFGQPSSEVLPTLVAEKKRIQFAYIDSVKLIDVLMVDVFYITKMMDNGGVLVLDDCDFPGIRLLARFLSRLPSYEVLKGFSPDPITFKSKASSFLVSALMKSIPFRKRKFPQFDLNSDAKLRVNYKCIAFRKVADETRPWNWHQAF